jgi:S1-C subfamily serine protease
MRIKIKHSAFAISVVLLLALLSGSVRLVPPVEALSRSVTQRVVKSVVQIIAVDVTAQGRVQVKWTGSGTIISKDGLILTNCHVALPSAMFGSGKQWQRDALIVALTTRTDKPPTPTYVAEVVQYDPNLDLAVIRVTKTLDGSAVKPGQLNLPALPIGDSDKLELGDPISIFGYPGIGGETITFTSGDVSGFTSERGVEGRAWIKTDATIAGGNSGGTGVTEDGALIGVPTRGGAGSTSETVDCRQIADTNGDGKIDQNDTCVPMGGFINSLRPVDLAKPLIEAARRGLAPQPTPQAKPSLKPKTTSGKAEIPLIFFSPAVDQYDQAVTVVDSFPAGTETIYIFFDYENFQDGTPWSAEMIYSDGAVTDTWPVENWNGGASGTWWLSYGGRKISNGVYQFIIFYDGQQLGSASVKVGGSKTARPSFSNVAFSGDGQRGYFLPAGVQKVKATVDYANMTARTPWRYVWFFEGREVYSEDGPAFSKDSGQLTLSLTSKKGFPPGRVRLQLFVAGKLAATADALVSGERQSGGGKSQTKGDLFGPITFGSELDRDKEIADPGTSFQSGIDALYAQFPYQGMRDGWEWTRRWSLDGRVVIDKSEAWEGGEQGKRFSLWITNGKNALPDGHYKLELFVQGQLVQSGEAQIGRGTAPSSPTPVPQSQGVQIYGYIKDADTNRGIPGAAFLVLKPGITVNQFQWSEEEVYAYGTADNNGYYELSAPLARGETYSFIVGAKGYRTYSEDGITVPENLQSPHQLDATLQRAY